MKYEKPPLAIEVADLANLARLAMSRVDVQPLFWSFNYRRQRIFGNLLSIPYWDGSLPIFAYTKLPQNIQIRGYVGYTNIGSEKVFFTDSASDAKFLYGPVVEIESPPKLIANALSRRRGLRMKPIPVKARNLYSLLRVLLIMSDNTASPPIWHYEKRSNEHVLGVIAPFYEYYEASALPVFFYVELSENPGPFIKYQAIDGKETLEYASKVSDMKHFYARVITVKQIPFLKLGKRGGCKKA
ncbi:MAG: hypothetical protein J7L17_01870 [Thaumarchaeota archaeon]|nr:hypothetical protein [Nitrososphaerota archaeon]